MFTSNVLLLWIFQTIDNNIESKFHETSYMEPKCINQNIAINSDVKNEIISDQRNIDMDNKACLFETIYVASKQVNT